PARGGPRPPAGGAARPVDVPAQLNRWQVVAVSVCLLFGVLTATLQVLSWDANRAAADNTEQLVRVQNIQSTLLRADALATSAFLIGGLEPPAQRAAYDDAIDQVTRQVAEAAEAQPADREALAALNQTVTGYATTITQARDNNRQGFPVGSAYLSGASSSLRTDALPIVSALVAANSARAEDEMGSQRPSLLLLPGLLALAVLWWLNQKLAATFRRRFNLGLGAAFVGIGVLTVVAVTVSAGQDGDNTGLQDGSYRSAVAEATARSAANDARSNESLRLINRGSGAAFEEAYVQARGTVQRNATGQTLDLWTTYDGLHDKVVRLDEQGQWDQAVSQATSIDPDAVPDGSTRAFDAFDTASQDTIDTNAAATTDELRSGNSGILVLAVVSLLVGLTAAGACTWGIAARRREYA
ncbi:MAG: hypothetical protein LH468_01050, partial [Nocardioides sp.]|nr:hypothetical protein [Nocardioides sp.]